MRLEFEFVDFNPRKHFKEKANLALKKIYEKMPCDTVCEATCTYYSHYFFFQVIFYDRDKKFEAQCILNPKKEDTRDRNWQIKAIDKLEEQLDLKLQKWLAEREIDVNEKKAA